MQPAQGRAGVCAGASLSAHYVITSSEGRAEQSKMVCQHVHSMRMSPAAAVAKTVDPRLRQSAAPMQTGSSYESAETLQKSQKHHRNTGETPLNSLVLTNNTKLEAGNTHRASRIRSHCFCGTGSCSGAYLRRLRAGGCSGIRSGCSGIRSGMASGSDPGCSYRRADRHWDRILEAPCTSGENQ